jgi:hypothetical protein
MPGFSRVPLAERPTSDLVAGLIWCVAVASVAFVWLGSWVLQAGFNAVGLFLLAILTVFVGVPTIGVVKIGRELHRRRH